MEKATDEGVNTTSIIESLFENIKDTVYQKVTDAESIAGSENDDIVAAWEKFNEALTELTSGNYDEAIGLLKEAANKAKKKL